MIGVSSFWLVDVSLICHWHSALVSRQCHSSLVSLAHQGSRAVMGEVWSSLQTTSSAKHILLSRWVVWPYTVPRVPAVKSYGQICQDTMLFKPSQWYVKLDTLIYYIFFHFTFLFRFYHMIKRLYWSYSASYMCSWTTRLALSGLQFTKIILCLYTATQLDLQLNIRVFAYLDS